MSLKLRDLIRQVRACKTAAEERSVIAKESAMIRTAIREEQEQYRHRNVAKLLFMHMLGYPTHFGQLECLKLIASPHFPEKRIGYLGLLLLLSEEADVLMLATNSLKNDLNNSNKFIAGLALCGIGNLATADMSRDLAMEVDKHLKNPLPYLRKKACLAMSRCLIKVPEMAEDFVDRFVTLLKDRSHGVLLPVVELMTQVLILESIENEHEEEFGPVRMAFSKLVPTLVRLLRNLMNTGFCPEYEVSGISDPFLQVQLLKLLRLLGDGDEEASDAMNDVLAQVATNTESSKNAGNAILYECVITIMAVESDDALRTLAINILGRFLLNRDNNIRYVALNTMTEVVSYDEDAIQKHRSTIVDCLKDPDVSIRQRALELIYHLVNNENVESLTAELLNYMVVCPSEHRAEICTRVLKCVDRFSSGDRWRIDALITMLTIAGKECRSNVQSATIVYITRSNEDIKAYATHKLLTAIRDDDGSQLGLTLVGIWCIGEYGDFLLAPYRYVIPASEGQESVEVIFEPIDPDSVIDTIQKRLNAPACSEDVKQRALTCYAKLSTRFEAAGVGTSVINRLKGLVRKYEKAYSVETQLRATEYGALMGGNAAALSRAKETLGRMPAVDLEVMQRRLGLKETMSLSTDSKHRSSALELEMPKPTVNGTSNVSKQDSSGLLDFDDIFGGGAPAPTTTSNGSKAPEGLKSDADLLSDIFSAPVSTPSATQPPTASATDLFGSTSQQPVMPSTSLNNQVPQINDLFGSSSTQAPTPTAAAATHQPMPSTTNNNNYLGSSPEPASSSEGPKTITAMNESDLDIIFECSKTDSMNPAKTQVIAKFKNKSEEALNGLNMQCAVPKYITMEMQPPSSTTVPAASYGAKEVTQTIILTNSMLGQKNLMMKLKVSYTTKGAKQELMATCSAFPPGF